MFVHQRDWQATTVVGRPPSLPPAPPETDQYDLAYIGDAIRLDERGLFGARDAGWTIRYHVKRLAVDVRRTRGIHTLCESAHEMLLERLSSCLKEGASGSIIPHLVDVLAILVIRLAQVPSSEDATAVGLWSARCQTQDKLLMDNVEPLQEKAELCSKLYREVRA